MTCITWPEMADSGPARGQCDVARRHHPLVPRTACFLEARRMSAGDARGAIADRRGDNPRKRAIRHHSWPPRCMIPHQIGDMARLGHLCMLMSTRRQKASSMRVRKRLRWKIISTYALSTPDRLETHFSTGQVVVGHPSPPAVRQSAGLRKFITHQGTMPSDNPVAQYDRAERRSDAATGRAAARG
jgi:hypothetical protein